MMYSSNIDIKDINKKRRSLGIISESITDNQMKVIDRIIKNHKVIEEKSDLDIRSTRTDISNMICEICECISNFNMDEHKKFIIAVGEVSFLFDYNNIKYESSDLIDDISDYFIIANEENSDLDNIIKNMRLGLKTIIEEVDNVDNFNVYLLKESEYIADTNDVKTLIEKYKTDPNKSDSKLKNIIIKLYTKSPKEIIDGTPSILKLIRYFGIIGTVAINPFLGLVTFMVDQWIKIDVNRSETEKLYKIFKHEKDKLDNKIYKVSDKKAEELKSYSKCLDNCMEKIEEFRDSLYTDDELDRRYELEESCKAIIYANELIPNNYKYQNEYSYLLDQYQLLITRYRLESKTIFTADDVSYVDKFMKLNNVDDLKLYYTESCKLILSLGIIKSDENIEEIVCSICKKITSSTHNFICLYDKMHDNLVYKIYLISKFRVEFNTAEEDEYYKDTSILYNDIEEMVNIINIEERINKLNESGIIETCNNIKDNISIIESSSIELSSVITNSYGIIDINEYVNLLQEAKQNNTDPCIRTNLSYSINKINNSIKSNNLNVIDCLDIQLEAANLINNIIHEKVDMASLKVASINLLNKAKELGNKEKEISRKFDLTLSTFRNKMEKALTTDRREAIIKGSIIPSASKCIKLALATGAAFLVNPVLAIIGSVGALAISKGCTEKERQILLDEIEIELKAVNKEISIAESDSNMKKYRQLSLYKNKLEREAQRIRYNIQITGRNVSERESDGGDD